MASSVGTGVMFGAVYFRKSNPPRKDWERDYAVAAADGHTLFRHWVPWGAVETAPGVFDWDDYDRHLDLAAKHGIRTVLAEFVDNCPEWLHAALPHCRREGADGRKWASNMHISCVTGGAHAMCLDNPAVRDAAGRFLTEMAVRYRGHPALLGYDLWNECSFYSPHMVCYCPGTQERFRDWLRGRYADLDALGRAWHRYSFTERDQVRLPTQVAQYPDVFDAIEFQVENAAELVKWRADTIRTADPDCLITAHGNAKSFADIAPACGDDWRPAEHVDVFGYTYWQANVCHPFMAGDMIRSASRGKPFWRAEAVGDSSWNGRRRGRPSPQHDAMHDPANIRVDALISLACGATAYQTPRWRPLLDGPLFGAYGWYGMDGSRTDRSEEVRALAQWAAGPALAGLWQARPVRGDVALLICEESQAWNYADQGDTAFYSTCVRGAYEAFLDSNIQCDLVKPEQIGDYDVVYVPFPVALTDDTAERLLRWVRNGGRLVAEGCFGYFNGHGHAFPQQPNRGFEHVFGCMEDTVSFAPDVWDRLALSGECGTVRAALYRQSYSPNEGRPVARYEDRAVAAVSNDYGKGKAMLVGSMPSFTYRESPDEGSRAWFASLPVWAEHTPRVSVDRRDVVARVWTGRDSLFLWIVNMSHGAKAVRARLAEPVPMARKFEVLRGTGAEHIGDTVRAMVPGRDAVVLSLA